MSTVYSDKHDLSFRVSMMDYTDDIFLSFTNATMGQDVTLAKEDARALADLLYAAAGQAKDAQAGGES